MCVKESFITLIELHHSSVIRGVPMVTCLSTLTDPPTLTPSVIMETLTTAVTMEIQRRLRSRGEVDVVLIVVCSATIWPCPV